MDGTRMRYFRKKRGLRLKDVAEALDVHETAVSKWELNKREPGAEQVRRIAELLEVSQDELQGGRSASSLSSDGYVESPDDITRWRDQVIRDPNIGEKTQLLLMTLPALLDRDHWILPITKEQFVRETGRSRELVDEHWGEILDSEYVERLGENEWTLKLRFPD